MTSPDDTARRAAWTRYWATGGLHSCTGSFSGNYSGAIGAWWTTQIARLQPGQRLLDLATGNGPLPLMLLEQRSADSIEVDAVDLAQVAPAWFDPARHRGIRFHSGVAMEQLPFDDASFDRVVSQFGFEYARRGPALQECLRVCRPDGGLALVMHHAGSVLVEVGRSELANQALLQAPGGLFDAAAAVIPWFARARSGEDLRTNAEALACREAYNAAIRTLAQHIATSRAPDLLVETRDGINRLLTTVGPDAGPALSALQDYRNAQHAAGLRTAEMIAHALEEDAAKALLQAIGQQRPDADLRCEPLVQREGVLAWALSAMPRP
jgi:ubiquinone/menaquinone biosynthesis C-methylase UbiE